jgi:hypothetical protein
MWLYRDWFAAKVNDEDPAVLDALARLTNDSVLACWCWPGPCHTEAIAALWAERQSPSTSPLALSVKQPWAWAIVQGVKRVENRSRRTHYRGRLLIHASADPRSLDLDCFPDGSPVPDAAQLALGAIVGSVVLIGCDQEDDGDPWADSEAWHWRMVNPRPLAQPVPCKGALGLWKLPAPGKLLALP